jgi:nucleoside-diphosphate-sugar epimerase
MRILLTGSSGWLGRFLAPLLRRAGHEPFGLDVAPGPHTQRVGSIADAALVRQLFAQHRFDGVIHAAALHKPDIARYPRQAFVDVNVTGTLNLLEAAVAHGASRFVFTSTTSLMITEAIRAETASAAVWLDESSGPLRPRNIYGVTKRAAEELARLFHAEHGLPVVVLRTARFFPEEDDTHRALSGENMKANEFLHRRLTVEDCARALYAARGWKLPATIGRVYDAAAIERDLGFRCRTDFSAVLAALREGRPLPFEHDPAYTSPKDEGRS